MAGIPCVHKMGFVWYRDRKGKREKEKGRDTTEKKKYKNRHANEELNEKLHPKIKNPGKSISHNLKKKQQQKTIYAMLK